MMSNDDHFDALEPGQKYDAYAACEAVGAAMGEGEPEPVTIDLSDLARELEARVRESMWLSKRNEIIPASNSAFEWLLGQVAQAGVPDKYVRKATVDIGARVMRNLRYDGPGPLHQYDLKLRLVGGETQEVEG